MADAFRQMQKIDTNPGGARHGRHPYGCHCCQALNVKLSKFKKWSRRQARKRLKRLPDEFINTRR